jgi:hypothetical protein
MEEHESQDDSAPRRPPAGRGTQQHRSRAQQLLSAQRARLEQIETDLTSQCDELLRTAAEAVATDAESAQRDLDRREETFAEQALLHNLSVEQLAQHQDALSRKQADLDAERAQLAEGQQALRRAQAEVQHDAEQLARSRGRAQQLEERLARESEQLEVRREQTKNQRRRIAQELKAERTSQQHEVDELRRTIEHMRVAQQRGVEAATAELKQKREELEQRRQQHQQEVQRQREALEQRTAAIDSDAARLESKFAELQDKALEFKAEREKLAAAREELDRRERQLSSQPPSGALSEARETAATSTATVSELLQTVEELRQSHERLRESTEISEARHGELQRKHELLQQQYQELRREREASADGQAKPEWEAERALLIARAADAEQKLSQIEPQRIEDSQRRFEMAIADVRDLKRRNAELEEQLVGLRVSAAGSARQRADDSVSVDWEATKRRMLETLEADDGGDSPEKVEQRVTVESTIQITDEIVAQKDREIAELHALLSHQSSSIGAVAVGAAAIAENLDGDELILHEREKLRKLQEEWRDKLRQAEIDISIERARIARQRVEIEDKVSAYDSARAQHKADDSASNPGHQPKQPTRGRWLARLGLKDDGG